MKIIWSPQAKDDLFSLFNYVAADNPNAARKLKDIIIFKIEILSKTPNIGRPGRVPGTKELIIENTPYVIPYRCIDDHLEIIRVYHSARKWPVRFG